MEMWDMIIVYTLQFLLLFFLSQLMMNFYLTKLIKSPRHRRERRKGQSVWDWLTFKRFWDVIPKTELLYILYWANFVLLAVMVLITVVMSSFGVLDTFREYLGKIQLIVLGLPMGIRFASLGGYRKQ